VRSSRLDRLPPYLFAEMERKQAELRAAGRDVIDLGIGDPDLPPAEPFLRAVTRHLADAGVHQYSSSKGIPEFRAAAAEWIRRSSGVRLDPDRQIVLGVGSKEMIGHLPLAFTDPGDVVLFPEPGYPPYRSGTIFALCEPYVMPLRAERGFLPDLGAIPPDVARRARIIFVNYPNNPTGAVATRAFYEELVAFARRNATLVVADAAYIDLYYEERPVSFLETPGALDVGIEVYSMTKTFSMAGWRVAWAAGRADAIETIRAFKANLDSGQFMVLQKACAEALRDGEAAVRANRELYRRRRDLIVGGLRKLGWNVPSPGASIYVWFPTPDGSGSMAFADRMLQRAGVVLTPGIGFGAHGEGFLRISLTSPEERLAEAIERLSKS
jgi:LL-diaminopimelate aminotransferase